MTAPFFTYAFIGQSLTLSPLVLGLKLFTILVGSLLVALVTRHLVGFATIQRYTDQINGLNILLVFVFVAAVMENVGMQFVVAPWMTLGLAMLAFAVFFSVFAVTTLAFSRAGRERSLVLGFMASQRNMGLVLAVTGGFLPDLTWLYFALAQFPIYLSPFLLERLVRRLTIDSEKKMT